jgi:thioredoxin-dependent peroxiredoxin
MKPSSCSQRLSPSLLAVLASLGLGLTLLGCDKPAPPAPSTPTGAAGSAASAPVAAKPASALTVGDAAPAVTFALQDGKSVTLASLAGKNVAVYFYPKDETPGCTIEAQGIRDNWEALKAAGVVVIGVSTQDAASHKAFIEKEKLPYDLAVDNDEKLAKAFGVPVRMGFASRQTFLIGPDGKLKKVWRDVTPSGHAAEIIAAAKS